MQGEAGKIDRSGCSTDFGSQGAKRRRVDRILIVDPVPASRRALAETLAGPDRAVATAGGIANAVDSIGRWQPALLFVDRDLGGEDGLEFLCRLRRSHPQIERVLVMDRASGSDVRRAIAGGDLAFVVRKPWHPESLRQTVSDVLAAGRSQSNSCSALPANARLAAAPEPDVSASWLSPRRIESVSQALLTRLNACESEPEILSLLDAELTAVWRLRRWLWVGEEPFRSIRIGGHPSAPAEMAESWFDAGEWNQLERLRRRAVDSLLDRSDASGVELGDSIVGMTVLLGPHGRLFGLAWVDRDDADRLIRSLRVLRPGLQNALRRVRDAESRAVAARQLARRVSEDLRGPAGALAHAVALLRREAERSGVPSVWLEQVSSESRRVVEAIAHCESELIGEPVHRVAS